MAKRNVVIVGNGLFGSIAATLARHHGHTVTVVSNEEPLAASKASGCVLAPSWLTSLERSQVETALRVLGELYNVEDLTFQTNLLRTFKAQRVDPGAVLLKPDVVGKVARVGDGVVTLEDGRKLKGRVLVAAGVWSSLLVANMPAVKGLYGASVRYTGAQVDVPRIHVYAPYRQAVAVNLNKRTVWMGDGTALVQATWLKEEAARVKATVDRARELFGLHGKPIVNVGVRPYVEGHKAGYFAQRAVQTWVSTGGAKNGTVLAAWQAYRFLTEAL